MSSTKTAFLWTAFIVTGMLITGAINTVVKKLQNNWTAPGLNPRPHKVNPNLIKQILIDY